MSYLVQQKIENEQIEKTQDRLRSILLPKVSINHLYDGLDVVQQADKVMEVAYPVQSIELAVSQALGIQKHMGQFKTEEMSQPIFSNRAKKYVGDGVITHLLSFHNPSVKGVGQTKGSLLGPTKEFIPVGSGLIDFKNLRKENIHYGAEYVQAIGHISKGSVNVNFIVLLWDVYHPNPRIYIAKVAPIHSEVRPDMFDKNGKPISEYGLKFIQPRTEKAGLRVSLNTKDFLKSSSHIGVVELPKVSIQFNGNQFDDESIDGIENELAMRKMLRKSSSKYEGV